MSVPPTTRRVLKPGPQRAMLARLIEKAREWDRTATPEEKATMYAAQRFSWAIGELMLADPELTREEAERRITNAFIAEGRPVPTPPRES